MWPVGLRVYEQWKKTWRIGLAAFRDATEIGQGGKQTEQVHRLIAFCAGKGSSS